MNLIFKNTTTITSSLSRKRKCSLRLKMHEKWSTLQVPDDTKPNISTFSGI